jgi:hypothetical protein
VFVVVVLEPLDELFRAGWLDSVERPTIATTVGPHFGKRYYNTETMDASREKRLDTLLANSVDNAARELAKETSFEEAD